MRILLSILISLLSFSQVTAQQADTLIFQGGDQIGMPKANGGGLSEPYTSTQELTSQNTSPSATGVTIGGQNIPTSALPALIKDKSGDVFSVDAQGNVTEVGAYGGPAGMQKQTPNTALGITVSFAPVAGMKYGFDPFQPRYAEKPAMEPHYLKLGDQYYSAKAITPGDVDVIGFSVSPHGTKLRFVNRDGFEYKQNGGVLTLAGGPAEDAQEIMAVYTKGGKDYVVGALLLASYPVKHQNVVIVLTDAAQTITEAQRAQLEASLNASFGQAAMRYTVSVDATSVAGQGWCGSPRCSAFRPDGSALLSNDYQGDEAAMIEYFTTRAGFTADPSTAYLFAVSTSLAGTTEGGLQGKMNFDKQFGFLYNVQKEGDFTAIGRTLAHEVGHGSFKLYHIFENMYLGPDAKEDNNLMSYSSLAASNQLNKLQWDIVHKPGVTWGVFARDKDQEMVAGDRKIISKILNEIKLNLENGITDYNPFENLPSFAKTQDNYKVYGGLNFSKYQELEGYISVTNLKGANQSCNCDLSSFTKDEGSVYSNITFGDCFEISVNYESTYNFILSLLSTSVNKGVKAGKIIFVNGHYNEAASSAGLSPSTGFKSYWDREFEQNAKLFLNEKSDFNLYVDGSTMTGGDENGQERKARGKIWAQNNIKLIESNTVKNAQYYLFGHSEGAAFAAGIAEYLSEHGRNVNSIYYLAGDEMDEFDSPVNIKEAFQISYASCQGYDVADFVVGLHFPYDPVVGDNYNKTVKIYGVVSRNELTRDLLHGKPAFNSNILKELQDLKQLSTYKNYFIQNLDVQGKIYFTHPELNNGTQFLKIDDQQIIFCL